MNVRDIEVTIELDVQALEARLREAEAKLAAAHRRFMRQAYPRTWRIRLAYQQARYGVRVRYRKLRRKLGIRPVIL